MSLDVWLTMPSTTETGIFVRENGQTREITRQEWAEKFPGRTLVRLVPEQSDRDRQVFEYNITHNLNDMAAVAGIYEALWRPDERGITKAAELIAPLTMGLEKLRSDPDEFALFNPRNGWGDYEGLVAFVDRYLAACREYPEALVNVSR